MRGDLVTIAMQGDFGKPRPGACGSGQPVQRARAALPCCLSPAHLMPRRCCASRFSPSAENGLQKPFAGDGRQGDDGDVRSKVGPAFGRIDADALLEVERCLAVFLGIAK